MKMTKNYIIPGATIVMLLLISCGRDQPEGVAYVSQFGYDNCIELKNSEARVVLEPNLGGRILIYELHGKNVLYHDSTQNGFIYEPGGKSVGPSAGRFDIGPEKIVPRHPALFLGKWEGIIKGKREAQLLSQKDTSTGVQLIRIFKLAGKGSKLTCTQIIRNISNETKHYCAWSRTFVKGNGISLTPLNPRSRFPKGYLIYGPGNVMDFMPADEPNVQVRNGILEISGPTTRPKFVMDIPEGWLAYITQDDQLFIKKFPIYPERIYGEMSAANACIYYNKEVLCEIEPIGPMETIKPGEEASFTETWYLYDFKYPIDKLADQSKIAAIINSSK